MKQRIVGILLMLVLVCLTGCGAKGNAEDAFKTMMTELKSGELERISPYYDVTQGGEFATTTTEEMLRVIQPTLKDMKYEIEKVEPIDNGTVQITANVTTLNFTEVIDLYLENLMMIVEGEEYQSKIAGMEPEDYQKVIVTQMTELLAKEEIGTEEKTATVLMVKQEDGTWVPGGNQDQFFGLLFANLIGAVNSLI